MDLKKTLLAVLAVACLLTNATSARRLSTEPAEFNLMMARLEGEGGLMECWNALTEIKACSNEIIVYFMNGTTDIGPGCCKGITTITHHCWPAMLTTLGFTPEESNVLRGYCDAVAAGGDGGGDGGLTPSLEPVAPPSY